MKMRSGKGRGMESEEGLRMGYGEPPYLWKSLFFPVRKTGRQVRIETWVRGCQRTKEEKHYTEQLTQAIWQRVGHWFS